MQKLVSVIIPVYNVEKYLSRCIKSVINQTYKNIEIILVNDGSQDKSGDICDKYAKKDNRIKVIHQDNKGVAITRNTAIQNANGDFILQVDSDDFIEIDLIEKAINKLFHTNSDIVFFCPLLIDENQNKIKNKYIDFNFLDLENKVINGKTALKLLFNHKVYSYNWTILAKKNLYKNIFYPKDRIYEDTATLYKIYANAKKCCFINENLYYYLQRNNSLTNNISLKNILDMLILIEEIENYINLYFNDLLNDFYWYKCSLLTIAYINAKKIYDEPLSKQIKYQFKKAHKNVSLFKKTDNPFFVKVFLLNFGLIDLALWLKNVNNKRRK